VKLLHALHTPLSLYPRKDNRDISKITADVTDGQADTYTYKFMKEFYCEGIPIKFYNHAGMAVDWPYQS
jgi:hypothetical protein